MAAHTTQVALGACFRGESKIQRLRRYRQRGESGSDRCCEGGFLLIFSPCSWPGIAPGNR